MKNIQRKNKLGLSQIAIIVLLIFFISCGQKETIDNGWGAYKADPKSTSYSPLDQINLSNVSQLENVWIFQMSDLEPGADPVSSQSNPIIVDGVMYVNSGKQTVYAIDAATGKEIWSFKSLKEGMPSAASRGVTYWESGDDKRILYSSGNDLMAINAKTGKLIPSFGKEGRVNLNEGVRDDPDKISVTLTTPGRIYKDLIIIGSRLPDFYGAPPGYIRAYNCKTGELVWTFHTIPLPGEPGYETWPPDAYKYAGGANSWAGMSVDTERGMVFIALGSPSYDFYGADRAGENLYGNSVLALDAATGQYKWHFQTVHHDLWDYDLPSPPNLVTIKKDGKDVDAVAQVTKHGFIFVLDRDTGQPLFPVEERPVPQSNIPGEVTWPTQPFPLKPAPFVKQFMTEEDLNYYSEEDYQAILQQFRSVRYEGLFTPPDLKGTLSLPATRGGANWGGAAFDPNSTYLYIRGNNLPEIMTIVDIDKHFAARDNSVFESGRVVYMQHCATCHGEDKKGIPPTFPDVSNLKDKMSENLALEKIRIGGGAMPGYAGVLTEAEQSAIIAYLYDKVDQASDGAVDNSNEEKPVRYGNITAYRTWSGPSGNPAMKGPWGTLNALNLSTGEYEWQIPLGNDEKLQEPGGPLTGLLGRSGPMVTAGGLVFISGAEDKKIWAFDAKTGKMVWEYTLPAANNANVCSYQVNGKQYVALTVGGTKENPSGSVMAFALPR
ncbi:PQQ-binding-like beta-propeller repeat protein [Cecembia calidifontis]|jgi:quinoprotein glucose dehydrogenase|uniref:Quinoprotein glucose dehydrogenase n=1 Tax=Cecembia calidifontis TaxID=1187080 RepID=A0A4Q7P9G0_9BACT|nr:PQQ-binding-like beta-propeller repeat protein [Cecembia calidifontis]RZS96804.1 quinoprotein glucose dehydrogenase [Cecembia calidifontis]